MRAGDFYVFPPYNCVVIVDGIKRLAEATELRKNETLAMALTLYTMALKLKEPVSPSMKKYIVEHTKVVERVMGAEHGTAHI